MIAPTNVIPRGQKSYNYNEIKKEKPSIIEFFSNLDLTYPQTQSLLKVIHTIQRDLNTASLSEETIQKLETDLEGIDDPKGLIEKLMKAATHNSSKIFYNKETKINWFGYTNYTATISAIITIIEDKDKAIAESIKPYLDISHRNLTPQQIIDKFLHINLNLYCSEDTEIDQIPFFKALSAGESRLVKFYFEFTKIDLDNHHRFVAVTLVRAVNSNRFNFQDICRDLKIDVNKQDNYGETILMGVSEVNGGAECLRMLIKGGADINHKNLLGKPVWMFAFQHGVKRDGDPAMFKELIKAGAKLELNKHFSEFENLPSRSYFDTIIIKTFHAHPLSFRSVCLKIILENLTIEQINEAKEIDFICVHPDRPGDLRLRDKRKAYANELLEFVEKIILQAQEHIKGNHNHEKSANILIKAVPGIQSIFGKIEMPNEIINEIDTYNIDISTAAKARKYLIQQGILDKKRAF